MSETQEFMDALTERTPWVNEWLMAPALIDRVRPDHLRGLARAYLERGGKRLRPAVLMFCCGAVGGSEKDALPAAAALELFHTWTLMHDDIIDHDELRRGGASGHVLGARLGAADMGLTERDAFDYGTALSMLAGDVQHGLCVALFLQTRNADPQLLVQLVGDLELNVVCDLVEGETLDVQLESRPIPDVPLDEVLRMMYLKTGALYEFAGKAGAMLGLNTCDEAHPHVKALREFCADCGIAFQLQDDILGIVADESKLGKPVGSDIVEGKRTPILLKAYEVADATARARLDEVVGNPQATDAQVREITKLLVDLGALSAVEKMAREHIERAYAGLAGLPESQYTRWLNGWAKYMVERES